MRFEEVRTVVGKARPPRLVPTESQAIQMTATDGLLELQAVASPTHTSGDPGVLSEADLVDVHLWAVRNEDAVHAMERGPFGKALPGGTIKHTNLTGAQPAYSAGELLFLNCSEVIINGWSGRYGPRSAEEMRAVEQGFVSCGFKVWSMGFDPETMKPLGFIGPKPEPVA